MGPSEYRKPAFASLGPGDRVIAIGAHFDDIELGCGGVLAGLVQRGCQVTIAVLTSSSYTHATDGQHRSADLAYEEGSRAAEVLGVEDVRCLGLSNMHLKWDSESIQPIEDVLEDVQPRLIFTHWAFDTHQDHHYGAMASMSAARYFPSILMYDPIYPSGRSYMPFRPQIYFDITEQIDLKLESLREHASQHRKYGDEWLDAVRARARFRGVEVGVLYAEAFEVVRLLAGV